MEAVSEKPMSFWTRSPSLLDTKIPFYEERYSSQVKKDVEPYLFADTFYGTSTDSVVLGNFLTAVGSGKDGAGPSGAEGTTLDL